MYDESSASKKLVPLYLLQILEERTDETHLITMAEILDYFESHDLSADRRTVYAAIDILTFAGYNIQGKKGKGNYSYHLLNKRFNRKELKYLIDSVAASRFLTTKESRDLIEKIKQLGIEADRGYLNRYVDVGDRIKSMNDKIFSRLDRLYEAISENRQISFQYTRWSKNQKLENLGNPLTRSPLAVTLNDNNYYLLAFDNKKKALRHYRIDKMNSIRLLDIPREGLEEYKSFNAAAHVRKTFNMYDGPDKTVIIEAPNSLIGVFIERFGEYANIRTIDSTHFRARFEVHISPQFYGWLFGLGEKVVIISPEEVKEEYKKQLLNAAAHYQS